MLGLEREDVTFRDGNAGAVIERLDSQFEAQLAVYRFAHGGGGARFGYGDDTSLTIINGKMAPQVQSQKTQIGDPQQSYPSTQRTPDASPRP